MGPHADYCCANCDVVSDLPIKEAKTCPSCNEGPMVRLFNAINVAPKGNYKFGEKMARPMMEQHDKRRNAKADLEKKNEKLAEVLAAQPKPATPADVAPRRGITGKAAHGMVDGGGRASSQAWARALFGRKVQHRPA